MDFSDKIIIFCIIFLILAILSVIFNCYKFNKKTELFKNGQVHPVTNLYNKIKKQSKAASGGTDSGTDSGTDDGTDVGTDATAGAGEGEPFTNKCINKAVKEFFNKSDEKFMEYMQANKELFNNNKFIEKMSQKISKELENIENKKKKK